MRLLCDAVGDVLLCVGIVVVLALAVPAAIVMAILGWKPGPP